MAAADTAKLIAELSLKDKMSAGLKTAGANLGTFEKTVGRTGKGIGQVGAGVAKAGALLAGAAATGFAVAGKAAIEWEDAFAGVVKTVDEADLAAAGLTFEGLGRSIRDMSLEMPIAATELAAIAETAGALGIKAADIESFTRQVAILGSTTNVTTDEAATALGQLQNVIGLTGDEFDNFSAALVDLGNKGASTESQILEIARRSGGAAKLIGVAKDATLGWASAAANLGLNEELAGTALQNFFTKSTVLVAGGGKKLEMFAETAGKTSKEFTKAWKEDATGALTDFLAGLNDLEEGDRIKRVQKLFGKGSGLTRLILGLSGSIDQNLTPSLETSSQAWADGGAAAEEFAKRNATVRSAIARLKNGLTDAAVTVGEGFAPALGEAADKLSVFLKADKNREFLKNLGKDLGEAIRGIDWDKVGDGARTFVDVLKGALVVAKGIFDVVNALPTEIKAAGVAFLGLNKLSGGLLGAGVGNIIGALGETIAKSAGSKLPGVGKLFAQPVFVTNWPMGGLGGGAAAGAAGAAKGGLGLISKVALVGEAIGLAALVVATQQALANRSTEQAQAIKTGLDQSIAGKSLPQLKTALGGVQQGITDIRSNPLLTLVQGEALTTLQAMQGDLQAQIARIESLKSQAERTKDDTVEATNRTKIAMNETKRETSRGLTLVKSAAERTRDAALETKREAARGLSIVSSTTRSGTAQTVAAIRAIPAPIISVNISATTVKQHIDVKNRTGKSGGSRNNNTTGGSRERL